MRSPSPPPPAAHFTCRPLQARSPLLRLSVLPQKTPSRFCAICGRADATKFGSVLQPCPFKVAICGLEHTPKNTACYTKSHSAGSGSSPSGNVTHNNRITVGKRPQRRPSIGGVFASVTLTLAYRSFQLLRPLINRNPSRSNGFASGATRGFPCVLQRTGKVGQHLRALVNDGLLNRHGIDTRRRRLLEKRPRKLLEVCEGVRHRGN